MITIDIKLNEASITDAIRRLTIYRDVMEYRMQEVVNRLGAIGVNIVDAKLMSTPYPGVKDIQCWTESGENFCTIHAQGDSLMFVEFGAGVQHTTGQYASQAGAVPHGLYGRGQGANPNGWVYKGVAGDGDAIQIRPGYYWTYGNDAADAFPAAVEEIQRQVQTIVEEVFGNDRS